MLETLSLSPSSKNTMPSFQIKAPEFGNIDMHPQAMENAVGSIAYLLSLNTPHINLIINCFLAAPRPSPKHTLHAQPFSHRWTHVLSTDGSDSPLSLLENMLRHTICETWNNDQSLPYTPLSLRKDIPLQRDLDGAVFRLTNTTNMPVEGNDYATAQEAYRRRMENVRRALDAARRCDGDYTALQNAISQITPGSSHGDWATFFAVLSDALRTAPSYSTADELVSAITDLQASVARIFDTRTPVEEAHAEVPLLYLRLAYVIAAAGVRGEQLAYRGSPFACLAAYFDDVVVEKVRRRADGAAGGVGYKGCLEGRTTDWEGVYSGIRASRATGMARGL
ncbi:LOW QUALITY PROTEIN: hypothetical protein Dda_6680 [Drechslerella dactyloides]|uniref:Uncharacterized protein n=1 Tax=Drechslerella dactyloides TaxID=74499 RepID=A0AAD6IUL0_DREDA|nr:LOW QUALITY PROTEIN: hypothetical protein Dda_6680 [Drechslerella dactyloides]